VTHKVDHRWALAIIAVATIVIWQVPHGWQILYPLTLLATYAHEMGHGLTAILVGGSFESVELFADGSGLAQWTGDVGSLGRAAVSAGGLVGPSVAGAILIALTRRPKLARHVLMGLGATMLLTVLWYVRSLFGVAFVGLAGVALFALAQLRSGQLAPFTLQLVGVQLCLAIFRDVGYMFSPGGLVGGEQRMSDSAQIADALLGPYWFWGGATAAFSFAVLFTGVYLAFRGKAPAPHRAEAAFVGGT
jgi:hypothetical protein